MPAQLPDIIYVDGDRCDLFTNPLEEYWRLGNRRPRFLATPECQRGYVAFWEIVDLQLYLTRVNGFFRRRLWLPGRRIAQFSAESIFRNIKHRSEKATWFSGKLRLPMGKMIIYQDSGYDSRFEKERLITVEKGDVRKIVTLDYLASTLTVDHNNSTHQHA